MEKTLKEVKLVLDCRKKENAKSSVNFLAAGLSARRNLCINADIMDFKVTDKVDAECRKLTAEWVY